MVSSRETLMPRPVAIDRPAPAPRALLTSESRQDAHQDRDDGVRISSNQDLPIKLQTLGRPERLGQACGVNHRIPHQTTQVAQRNIPRNPPLPSVDTVPPPTIL
ncbi:hypothetical protein FAIPA1_220043 [Frankia sp. AiPs1]